jgi:molybdopterin molybdotransferase
MRPGKPLAFGTLPRRRRPVLVLGLPGNPVSAQVTFALFGVPLLKQLQGHTTTTPATTTATLADDGPFKKKPGLTFFARAIVDGGRARTLERQGSGQVSGLAAANALVVFAKDAEVIAPGAVVDVIAL